MKRFNPSGVQQQLGKGWAELSSFCDMTIEITMPAFAYSSTRNARRFGLDRILESQPRTDVHHARLA